MLQLPGNDVTSDFDLDAYFARIGYSGPRSPTIDTLEAIHACHPQAIPFENLNPLLHWPVRLDAASLQQKLVREGRGGYCFEQNLLLYHALQALDFKVTGLAARVLWNAEGAVRARSHMLLLVDLNGGPYVADVGFGGLTLTAPLRLATDIEQATPHEPFRLTQVDGGLMLEARIESAWKGLYIFDLQPQALADYELPNWYLCNHPESHFLAAVVAARVDRDRRFALRNADFAVYYPHRAAERRTLINGSEIRRTLEDVFQIQVPAEPEVNALFERLAGLSAATT